MEFYIDLRLFKGGERDNKRTKFFSSKVLLIKLPKDWVEGRR